VLSDLGVAVLALAVVAGAWWSGPVPVGAGVAAALAALVARWPRLLVVAGFLLAAGLGVRAHAGLAPPEPGRYEGIVTLVSDPKDTPWGARADVRVGSKRYELQAARGAAGAVGRSLAGERLRVVGRLRPPPDDAPWLRARHVVGRLTVDRAERHDAGAAPFRAANRFRRLLERGAEVMAEPARGLYGGFVLGDDRGQSAEVVDDFRAAGLTHLLVVSGANVAYLLVLARPLTDRLGLWSRWVVTLTVIGSFAVVTRFEPSILRASVMAALAVTAGLAGRPSTSLRTIGLAVSLLVLVDPLLVHAVAFQLSVAASLGIIVLSRPLTAALPGPRWVRDALGVTLAAQLAVAPVLVPRFGGMPVVAIPANVLAVPAAGLVTTWGLPAGVVAGIAGPDLGRWLHLPTSLAIEWVAGTARVAAGLALGELRVAGLVTAVVAGGIAVVAHGRGWPTALTRGGVVVVVAVLLAPAVALRSHPAVQEPLPGVVLHRSGGATVLVVDDTPTPGRLLEALRRVGVRRLDLVVLPTAAPAVVDALRHRWSVGRVIEADGTSRVALDLGDLTVEVDATAGTTVRQRVPAAP
jgi:ComEC/Rec2-related protein